MKNLKYKIVFMVSMFLLISQVFFIPQGWCESSLKDMIMTAAQKSKDSKSSSDDQNKTLTIPASSVYQGSSKDGGKKGNNSSHAKLVDDLGDCDLSTKCYVLKAAGATNTEAKILLVGKGYNSDDVNKALGGNKSNTSNANNFLVNRNPDPLQDPSAVPTKKVEITDNASSKSSASVDSSKKGGLHSLILRVVKMAEEQMQGEFSALKDQGSSATDVLKSATERGLDMAFVAGAMKSAGFSNADIAKAYISKAMDWASDTTVDVVNCAVQSLSEVLSGQGNIGSTVALAYEVIVSDIMQTGKVNIQDGQIMSSMNAIQEIASEHGVELQGVSGTMVDLENTQGSAIVHLDNNHWATVTDIKGDTVTVMDNNKEVTMTKAELQARWDGNMLTQDSTTNAKMLSAQQMINIKGSSSVSGNENASGGDNGYGGSESESSGGNGSSWSGNENVSGGPNGYGGNKSESSGNGSSWSGNENVSGGPNGYGGNKSESSGGSGSKSNGNAGKGKSSNSSGNTKSADTAAKVDTVDVVGAVQTVDVDPAKNTFADASKTAFADKALDKAVSETGFVDKAIDAVTSVVDAVVDVAKAVADVTGLSKAYGYAKEAISTVVGAVVEAAVTVADFTGLTGAFNSVVGAAKSFADATGISTVYGHVKDLVNNTVTSVKGMFSSESVNITGDNLNLIDNKSENKNDGFIWPAAVKPVI